MSGQPIVYVSSTFEDLRGERAVVQRAVARCEAAFLGMESYGASDKRPLAKCIEDVERSDLYVGIIAWRRGFCPKETPGISITESEYAAAGRSGIPRYIYVVRTERPVQGQSESDRAAQLAFRQRVSLEQTVGMFDTELQLAELVGIDLKTQIDALRAVELPQDSLLPFLCDRQPQALRLTELLFQANDQPVICLLHGAEEQKITKFIECVRTQHLASWLGTEHPTTEYELRCPDDIALGPDTLRLVLGRALGLPIRGLRDEAIRDKISATPGPVLLTLEIPDKALGKASCEWVTHVSEYFRAWPRRSPAKPELVLLWAQYPDNGRGIWSRLGLTSQNTAARGISALEEKVPHLLLPPARSVPKSEGIAWARMERVRKAALGHDLENDVARLFDNRAEIPMKTLSDDLFHALRSARRRSLSRGPA